MASMLVSDAAQGAVADAIVKEAIEDPIVADVAGAAAEEVVRKAIADSEGIAYDPNQKVTTMRIPHTIPEIALRTYEPSEEALAIPGEQSRPLRAEDFGWDAAIPQPLTYWCVLAIVDNFKDKPLMWELPPMDRDHLLEKLPIDTPLPITVNKVPEGYFWRRCCEEKWKTMNYVDEYGDSWKRMYLERYLEQHLEEMEVEDFNWEDLEKLSRLLSPFVLRLRLRQLQVPKSLEEQEQMRYEELMEERRKVEDEEEVVEIEEAPRPETPEEKKGGVATSMLTEIFFPEKHKENEEMIRKKKEEEERKNKGKKKKDKKKDLIWERGSEPAQTPKQSQAEPEPKSQPEETKSEEPHEGWPLDWVDPCVPRDDISLDHINLEPVLKNLTFLQELSIMFGVRTSGMQFRWEMFLFSRTDIMNITKGIKDLPHLRIFRLTRSTLDEKLGPVLIRGLAEARKLQVLDLSHCRLGDVSACALGQLLLVHPRIEDLDLTNNFIGPQGTKGLSYALQKGSAAPLDHLNLRLNHIGDDGVATLSAALERALKPSVLNLAACGIGVQGALHLARALKSNRALRVLDLSNNSLGDAGGEYLARSMTRNTTLIDLDLRMTNITPLKEYSVIMQVESNKAKIRKISDEIKDMLKDESVGQYERTLEDRIEEEKEEEMRRLQEEKEAFIETAKQVREEIASDSLFGLF